MSTRIAVMGTTGWGTTLAVMLATGRTEVVLWSRTEEEAVRLNADRQNIAHLPNIRFPESLTVLASPAEVLEDAALAILAMPAQTMRDNLRVFGSCIPSETLLLIINKGIEIETTKRMSEVIAEEIGGDIAGRTAVLSGPNFAKEVIANMPTATVIASPDSEAASRIQYMVSSPTFRAYINDE